MKNKHKFITIEGIDGAGKSTFIPFIHDFLLQQNESVILTREPGGTELGEELREFILENKMDTMTETLLIFAARSQHIQEVIKPALKDDKWVICDRFTDSTLAYQSAAKGLPESVIRTLQDVVQKDIIPGLTFVFDVPLSISKQRLLINGRIPDKFVSEDDTFKENVNLGYKNIVKKNPARCKLIDSSRSIEETKEQVLILLNKYYSSFI